MSSTTTDRTYSDNPFAHLALTAIQQAAIDLFDLGFTVFPQPHGKKAGFRWETFQFTRPLYRHLPALFAGNCNLALLCGKQSRNLFVIDCETKSSLEFHTGQLRERGIPLWASRSARGGHILLLCREGNVRNIGSNVLGDAEIRGTNCFVIVPPSLHPTKVFYEWLCREGNEPPSVSIGDIDWLRNGSGEPVPLRVNRRRRANPDSPRGQQILRVAALHGMEGDQRFGHLSKQTLDYLETGHVLPQGNRNRRLFNAGCDMAGCKFEEAEVTRMLRPIAEASGLSSQEVLATIGSAFNRPRTPSVDGPTLAPKPMIWRYALAYVNAKKWPGRTGPTDRSIACALIKRAQEDMDQHGTFTATHRQLMEIARVGHRGTVKKSLERLEARPFVRKITQPRRSDGNKWSFEASVLDQGKALFKEVYESEPTGSDQDDSYARLYNLNGMDN